MTDTADDANAFDLSAKRVSTLVELLDGAEESAGSWHEIGSNLRAGTPPDDELALAMAFEYMEPERGRDAAGGEEFAAMLIADTYRYPPPIDSLEPRVFDLWTAVADGCRRPAGRARLHDLLFVAKRGPRHVHARLAATAYLELGRGSWIGLYRAFALMRGLHLTRLMNNTDLADLLRTAMVQNARESIAGEAREPGVSLRLIGALIDDGGPPAFLGELVSEARAAYEGDVFIESETLEMERLLRRSDPDRCAKIDRERVHLWLAAAERIGGPVGASHLERAVEIARTSGQPDLLAEATVALQSINIEDLGLKTISAPFELTDEQVREFTDFFVDRDDLGASLTAFAFFSAEGPPSGNIDANRQALVEQRTIAPLQAIIRRTKVGGDGLPRWSPKTDEEHELDLLARQESVLMQVNGALLATALERIGQRHQPERGDVVAHLEQNPVVSTHVASGLADGLMRFWSGDLSGSLYVVMPHLEALARDLVRSLNEPAYVLRRQEAPGQYIGLGRLLGILRERGLDESWHRYLWTLLASPAGWNLRNELAHGFVENPGPVVATLSLQAGLYLATLCANDEQDSTT